MILPFRMNFPSEPKNFVLLILSILTDSFFSKLSKRKCSVIFVNCSSVGDLLRNAHTFSISPLKFLKNEKSTQMNRSDSILINLMILYIYLFHIFEEDKVQIGMISHLPGVQNVREKRRVHDFIVHKVLGEFFNVAFEIERFYKSVVMVKRDDDVFRVSGNVNHLDLQINKFYFSFCKELIISQTFEVSSSLGWSKLKRRWDLMILGDGSFSSISTIEKEGCCPSFEAR